MEFTKKLREEKRLDEAFLMTDIIMGLTPEVTHDVHVERASIFFVNDKYIEYQISLAHFLEHVPGHINTEEYLEKAKKEVDSVKEQLLECFKAPISEKHYDLLNLILGTKRNRNLEDLTKLAGRLTMELDIAKFSATNAKDLSKEILTLIACCKYYINKMKEHQRLEENA